MRRAELPRGQPPRSGDRASAGGGTRTKRVPARLKSVLLATDFSKGAAVAARRVARLPLAHSVTVAIVHVARTRPEATMHHCKERLAEQVAELRLALADAGIRSPHVRSEIVVGRPFETIARMARESELVVLGRHGTGGIVDLLLGSTAERVALSAAVPVLVVGPKAKRAYRRAIVGVDLSPISVPALELGAMLAPDATVEIVHAFDRFVERALVRAGTTSKEVAKHRRSARKNAARTLAAFFEPHDAATGFRQCVRAGDPRWVLLDLAKRRRADLIVVGGQKHSALARMLLGSVATAVLRYAECDVLVVPGKRQG